MSRQKKKTDKDENIKRRFYRGLLYRHDRMRDVDMYVLSIQDKDMSVAWISRSTQQTLAYDTVPLDRLDGGWHLVN